jgi:hypothetical protein
VKVEKRFPLHVAITLAVGLTLARLVVLQQGEETFRAVVAGAVLSTLNALVGFLTIELSLGKSHTTFLRATLGGMGIRIGVMLVVLVALVRLFGFHATALVVSVLGFYIVYLVLEIIYIQKKASDKAR